MLLELYIRLFRTGTLAEYPVMSASQGAYVQIKQTSEATRETYKEYFVSYLFVVCIFVGL